jgi:hypothetical protein
VDVVAGGATVWYKRQTLAKSSTASSTHFIVGGERKRKMQVQLHKGTGVVLLFPQSEMNVALAVLKALHTATGQEFLKKAISDLEEMLKPKELPFKNYFHICRHCVTEMDERSPNAYLMTTKSLTGEEDSYWIHYQCPELKNDRP